MKIKLCLKLKVSSSNYSTGFYIWCQFVLKLSKTDCDRNDYKMLKLIKMWI